MSMAMNILAGVTTPGFAAGSLVAQAAGQGAGVSDWASAHFGWIVVGVIVLIGLAVGHRDLLRLSPRRMWAISSVGFRESIRRRVLWVTPLAILGIVAVTQLSDPVDEQDAIRQTTKYCLFASGVVVVVATMILACTNLPKEIDNRVIYTIVTKPATRLEIVLGKTLGFARTAAAILLVMGLFSYVYLQFNAAHLRSSVRHRLETLAPNDPSRDTLKRYADEGLLQARTYARPVDLQVYAEVPKPGDPYTWVLGAGEQSVSFPITLPPELFDHQVEAELLVNLQVAADQPRPLNKREVEEVAPDPTATTRPTTQGAVQRWPGKPRITVSLLDENAHTAVTAGEMIDVLAQGGEVKSREPGQYPPAEWMLLQGIADRHGVGRATLLVPGRAVQEKLRALPAAPDGSRRVYVTVVGESPATRYGFGPNPVEVVAAVTDASGQTRKVNVPIGATAANGQPLHPMFRGRLSYTRGQQLRGDPDRREAGVGVFAFRGSHFDAGGDTVPFEFRTKVERSGEAEATEAENVTQVELVLQNRKTGYTTAPILINTDSDRPTFFDAPRAAVEGGDFDLQVRSRTYGHYVGLRNNAVAVVAAKQSFGFNLFKSLTILWLLAVLVVIISIFTSTFVSWPIAVVLTLVMLLGRWCVMQIGEPTSPQQMVTDLIGNTAGNAETRVLTDTFGALNKLLGVAAQVLPDLDQFRVTEDIERGVTIPLRSLLDAGGVILTFGVPVLILAYVFLRRKEVAP